MEKLLERAECQWEYFDKKLISFLVSVNITSMPILFFNTPYIL